MRFLLICSALLLLSTHLCDAQGRTLLCHYDSRGAIREGLAQFSTTDLEIALQFCTHIIYGYAGIKPNTFELTSLNTNLDFDRRHFAQITAYKERYPHIKFLLSVGGDHDLENPEKYINFLEAGRQKQNRFVESARDLLRRFNFDGLDLAFQFPRNKPRKVHSDAGMVWKKFKKLFTGDFIVDEKSNEHREQFTDLVKDLRSAFRPNDLMLTLTVLPNVNSSWYFDVPALANNLDFVTMAGFDFVTPERNPEEADYFAPIYEAFGENRLPHYNIDFQIDHWLTERLPANKLILGIASYGRAWKMTKDSGNTGLPVVPSTEGPAPAGPQTKTPGFLNWAEICAKLPNPSNARAVGPNAPLRRISDPTKRYGTYAFRTADENGEYGMWVSYEDPDTASSKAAYAISKNLAGVALFDLTQDDFRGQCSGDKYPMLRAIKYRLLQ